MINNFSKIVFNSNISFNDEDYIFEKLSFENIRFHESLIFTKNLSFEKSNFDDVNFKEITVQKDLKFISSTLSGFNVGSASVAGNAFSRSLVVEDCNVSNITIDQLKVNEIIEIKNNQKIEGLNLSVDCPSIVIIKSIFFENESIVRLFRNLIKFSIYDSSVKNLQVELNSINKCHIEICNNSSVDISFDGRDISKNDVKYFKIFNNIAISKIFFKNLFVDSNDNDLFFESNHDITACRFENTELYNVKFSNNNFNGVTCFEDSCLNGIIMSDCFFENIDFIKKGSKKCTVKNTGAINVKGRLNSDQYVFISSEITGRSSDNSELCIKGNGSVFDDCVISNICLPFENEDYFDCFISCRLNSVKLKGSPTGNLRINFSDKTITSILFSAVSDIYKSNFSGLTIKEGKVFENDVIISDSILKNTTFENINFETEVHFVGCVIEDVNFKNCNFKSDIHFNGCKIKNMKVLGNVESKCNFDKDIVFTKCEFIDDFYAENVKFNSSIKLDSCMRVKNFSVKKSSLNDLCYFAEDNIESGFIFSQIDLYGNADFSNSRLSGSKFTNVTLKVENSFLNFENAVLENVEFDHIRFENFNYQKNVNFRRARNWEDIKKIDQPSLNYLKNLIFGSNYYDDTFLERLNSFLVKYADKLQYFCLLHKVYNESFISFNSFNEVFFGDMVFKNKFFLGCDFTISTFSGENFGDCEFLNCYFSECEKCDTKNNCRLTPCVKVNGNRICPGASAPDDEFDGVSDPEVFEISSKLSNLSFLIKDHYDRLADIFTKTDNYENNMSDAFSIANGKVQFKLFITACYQLFKEGAGDRFPNKLDIIDDIKIFRNRFQHDLERDADRKSEQKREEFNTILKKYNIFEVDDYSKNYSMAQLKILDNVKLSLSGLLK